MSEPEPNVKIVLPLNDVKPYKCLAPNAKTQWKVFGVSARYPRVSSVALAEGRMFDGKDEAEYAQVCVIGDEIRRNLFGYGPAIGKQLKVNDVWLEVVGIFAGDAPGASSSSRDVPVASNAQEIWIPVSTAMRKFDRDP